MEKITEFEKWNVYIERIGMSSTEYVVSLDGNRDDFNYVNNGERAMTVCKALNNDVII